MKINPNDFRARGSKTISLRKRPTAIAPVYKSKADYQKLLQEQAARLSALQELLYASNRFALLLIFQGMDTAGKDGAIKHVMSGVNPQGCQVFSFRHPCATELQHDFLWRTSRDLPERGRIGIFNRSYYEEVLIVRVHRALLGSEGMRDPPHDVWQERFCSIADMERHLHINDTRIVKFFLHISKSEQRKRLLERIGDKEKTWKFSFSDVEERKRWKQYMSAYEEVISVTSTRESPWYVIPADDKDNARLIISQIVVDTLQSLKMSYPKVDASLGKKLEKVREELEK